MLYEDGREPSEFTSLPRHDGTELQPARPQYYRLDKGTTVFQDLAGLALALAAIAGVAYISWLQIALNLGT